METYDDSRLIEEAERRQIGDEKREKATGEERALVPSSSSGGSRTELSTGWCEPPGPSRIQYLKNALADRRKAPASVPPRRRLLAQIWMAHIAAFLAARVEQSDDGEDFVCLEAWHFAEVTYFVLCRALIGKQDRRLSR